MDTIFSLGFPLSCPRVFSSLSILTQSLNNTGVRPKAAAMLLPILCLCCYYCHVIIASPSPVLNSNDNNIYL